MSIKINCVINCNLKKQEKMVTLKKEKKYIIKKINSQKQIYHVNQLDYDNRNIKHLKQ